LAPKPSTYKRHDELLQYSVADRRKGLLAIATSVPPALALIAITYLTLGVSLPLTIALEILTAGFLVRSFVIFHDCGHGSLLPTKRENTFWGIGIGLLVLGSYHGWKYEHTIHHAHSGDLDKRGVGDVETWTVNEYHKASVMRRLGYRAFRNPVIMFGLGPILAMIIAPRLLPPKAPKHVRRYIMLTNIALALLFLAIGTLLGWVPFLLSWAPAALAGGSAGVWLFYVQHQFEDTYWQSGDDWSYADAALQGSSYLKLPKVLDFFSAQIGLHHVHHLNARIPHYNLHAAHASCEVFKSVPVLSVMDGVRATRLKLWDEDSQQLLTFAQARRTVALRAQPIAASA
jgi:acyl-lipid omega-6 desaturase (Delta-12 desaturase)